ncbi:MAG: hypothetical protein AB7F41_02785 [Methylocystis sp.]|uniref:hypothetical protein n=1 Tax=Methylocystis sp. TaxID=1911079 RepID=UPI003D0E6A0A
MGKVIALQPRMRATSTRRRAPERDAEILFFLGVRYVRMEDAFADRSEACAPKSCDAPTRGGKRRRRGRA